MSIVGDGYYHSVGYEYSTQNDSLTKVIEKIGENGNMQFRKCNMLLLAFVCICYSAFSVFATNPYVSSEAVSEKEKTSFVKAVAFSRIEDENLLKYFSCFSVKSSGEFAIANHTFDKAIVSVYSADGCYQYSYRFNSSGTVGIEWEDNNLIIYFIREAMAISITPDGTIADVKRLSFEEEQYYDFEFVEYCKARHRTVGQNQYEMRNDPGIMNIFAIEYAKLIKTDAAGNKVALYDRNTEHNVSTAALLIMIGGAVVVLIWLAIKKKATKE